MGYKLPHIARTHNLTCNHRRKILNTTSGHPARFNDKSLILYDEIIQGLKSGQYDKYHNFDLCDFNDQNDLIVVKYRGCYVVVDNSYLRWSVTVPPIEKLV